MWGARFSGRPVPLIRFRAPAGSGFFWHTSEPSFVAVGPNSGENSTMIRPFTALVALSVLLSIAGLTTNTPSAAEDKPTPFADPKEKEKVKKALEALTGKQPKKMGAHRPQDPHAKLGPDRLIQVALQHLDEGRAQHAIDTLTDGLIRHPGQPDMLTIRGSLLLQQGRTADALSDLEQAAKAAPDNPSIYINRAQAFRRFGNTTKAMADLDKAIELDPDSVAARFNRGSMHFNAQRFDQALIDSERCIAVDPHAPPPYFNLAMTREQLGDTDGAIADLKRFLELAQSEDWRDIAEKKLAELSSTGTPGETPDETPGKAKE